MMLISRWGLPFSTITTVQFDVAARIPFPGTTAYETSTACQLARAIPGAYCHEYGVLRSLLVQAVMGKS